MPKRMKSLLCALLFFCLLGLASPTTVAAAEPAKVYVILWFDTEDYLLPASDDAALHLADFLTAEGIRATFKVVGEKARTLERRKRDDVIAALKKHEIGFHSNWHSVQPSPAMYLSQLGWDEGVREFDRREGPGRADVERIFGQAPTCYGQPGSSWGPQSYGAMSKWGMEVYLDAGSHVNLDDKPCYYGGVLNLYKLAHTLRADLNDPKQLQRAEDRFAAGPQGAAGRGRRHRQHLLSSLRVRPQAVLGRRQLPRGANPPREQWKAPPAKTAEETRIVVPGLRGLRALHQALPRSAFHHRVRGGQAVSRPGARPSLHAGRVESHRGGRRRGSEFPAHARTYALSASEVFALLNDYVGEHGAGHAPEDVELKTTPLGPTGRVPLMAETVTTDASQFRRTSVDVADFLRKQGRIPTDGLAGQPPGAAGGVPGALARIAQTVARRQGDARNDRDQAGEVGRGAATWRMTIRVNCGVG